jgi:hypothetical protein
MPKYEQVEQSCDNKSDSIGIYAERSLEKQQGISLTQE